MFVSRRRAVALATALTCSLPAFADDAPAATSPPTPAALDPAASAPPASLQKVEIVGARQKLDAARNGLSPDTGSTVYRFGQKDIATLPQITSFVSGSDSLVLLSNALKSFS